MLTTATGTVAMVTVTQAITAIRVTAIQDMASPATTGAARN
jgi:hypothetical protein